MIRIFPLAAVVLLVCASAFAQSNSTPPARASDANTPPAAARPLPHDHHEGLTISVDPYSDSERAKDKFGKSANPVPAGILPVEVFVSNETPHPLEIVMNTIELEAYLEGGKQDVDWIPVRQVAALIVHPNGPASPSTRRIPIGIPMPGKDKKVDKVADDLRPFALQLDVVPPLAKIHGFLFFNMSHNFEAALKSTLYVPDVSLLPDRKPLLFFEVPLTGAAASIEP